MKRILLIALLIIKATCFSEILPLQDSELTPNSIVVDLSKVNPDSYKKLVITVAGDRATIIKFIYGEFTDCEFYIYTCFNSENIGTYSIDSVIFKPVILPKGAACKLEGGREGMYLYSGTLIVKADD